jgi:hypothetical protein
MVKKKHLYIKLKDALDQRCITLNKNTRDLCVHGEVWSTLHGYIFLQIQQFVVCVYLKKKKKKKKNHTAALKDQC